MRRALRTIRSLAIAAPLLLAVGACRHDGDRARPDATYEVRGQLLVVPRSPDAELTVHHEKVPDFRDREGKPSHMDSMSMPFNVSRDVSLEGLGPGDKVAMTFEVRWQGQPTLLITELEKLPADTALDFSGPTLERVAPLGSDAPAAAAPASPTAHPPH